MTATSRQSHSSADSSAKQIRGSALLLVGRLVSLVLNLGTQVLTVRLLLRADYGAFAYSVSLVELAALAAAFGMDKTFAQFGAVYHERGDLRRLNGAFLFCAGIILGVGGLLAGSYWGASEQLANWMDLDPVVVGSLFPLVLLIPVSGFGSLVGSLFAVLGETRAVFYRRHLVGPIVKAVAVAIALLCYGTLSAVVIAYLISGLLQFVLDVTLAGTFAVRYRLVESFRNEPPKVPAGELLRFGLPVLASDTTTMVRGSLVVVLLGMFSGPLAAGLFRAVQPLVRLSELPLITFGILFTPLASRLVTRGHRDELAEMYFRTRAWVRVLTFPIFAVCVLLPEDVIALLFGADYLPAVPVLVVLAVGYYVQASFSFGTRMLKALGKVRLVVATDLAGTAFTLGFAVFLIPRSGAIGAAFAVAVGISLHSFLRELVVRRFAIPGETRCRFDRSGLSTAFCVLLVLGARITMHPGFIIACGVLSVTSLSVFLTNRRALRVGAMFPELGRFPKLQRLVSGANS